ncbi:MAG TPA: efflux RND transporter periplasmic adaptor subunit [Rudaea sp.]|nr:efflux RND transporter periplasmic adaptor subunit [Rudaea sp.]
MKTSTRVFTLVVAVLLAGFVGFLVGRHGATDSDKTNAAAMTSSTTATRKVLYWQAPMDPKYRRDKPGKSPMGMDLVPVYADAAAVDSDVRIDPAVVNNLGVRSAEVERSLLAGRIEAVGYVGYDEDTIVGINTRADGWIEKLAVKSAGDTVRSGQLLYELFSPKLATAQREYLTALASGSQSLIAASRERMRALGFSAAQTAQLTRTRKVADRVARYAQTAGVVVNLGVSEGAYVMPATQVMKLADLRTVWVLVEVDPANAARLRQGQVADVQFDALPDQHWQATLDYIYPDVNATTRTVKVRLRLDNPDLRLQPNMYAHVVLHADAQRDAVWIPQLALIRTGHSERVILALGDGRFDVCPVQAGISSGDRVEILKGLRAGQRVVTSAQFLIDSEANVDAAALRLGSAKPECTNDAPMPAQQMSGEHGEHDDHLEHSEKKP